MAVAPFLPDETKPTDSDLISQFPAVERTFRDIVESWINIDHDTSGFHDQITLPDRGSDPATVSNQGFVYTKAVGGLTTLFFRDDAGTVRAIDGFSTGTVMVFYQSAAPTGWTKNTTAGLNDHALKIVTSETWVSGSQGTSPFSTVFGLTQVANHAITISEMPNHVHTGAIAAPAGIGSAGGANSHAAVGGSQGSVGGNQGHVHNVELRVKYLDVILATKD